VGPFPGAPDSEADTVDLPRLTLLTTHTRVLTETTPVTVTCTPPTPGVDPATGCFAHAPIFSPAAFRVTCPGRRACVVELDLCLKYLYQSVGSEDQGAVPVVLFVVDGDSNLKPGPTSNWFGDLRVQYLSRFFDFRSGQTCVTGVAAEVAPGAHAVETWAGIDNDFTGGPATVLVHGATLIIRVYR
jgi:hypothetical protein